MWAYFNEVLRNLLIWIYIILTVPVFGTLAIIIRKHFWARIWCKGLLKILGIKIKIFQEKSYLLRYMFL